MELITENMNKLIKWQQLGSRCVTIKIEDPHTEIFNSDSVRIWCFDYDLSEGVHISEIEELPTVKSLREMSLAAKKKEIKELENRLKYVKENK